MRLRELSGGVRICPEIRLDSPLYTHNETALYLATDSVMKHTLVHILAKDTSSYDTLDRVSTFYREQLNTDCRIGEFEEFVFFAEPFPLGEYMFEWLERRERVSLADALKRTIELLKVLNLAHEYGIYHGRITPQSVLLERSGDSLSLRMMGLGVAQALNESIRSDIDWFDYTFDLEGMTPEAVDIYGVAIILMGLVSGENGIDSFEATGLLPQPLRGGIIQQAMERALALRIDAYPNVLAFSQDLEAALLESDEREGELYVGDLVGFESAIKSVTAITAENNPISDNNSGVWSSLIGTLEQEEKSSLLCSLTSLTAIKPVEDDEDEDITRISSLPKQVLSMQRIKSVHAREEDNGRTSVTTRPALSTDNSYSELPAATPSGSMSTEERMASLQSLEAELKGDAEEEDESPTRVMMRPNYETISFTKDSSKGIDSSIEDVINTNKTQATPEEVNPIAMMEKRIRAAVVTEMSITLSPDVIYRLDDPIAFPPEENDTVPMVDPVEEPNPLVKNAADVMASGNAESHNKQTTEQPAAHTANAPQVHYNNKQQAHHLTDKQKTIVRVLTFIVILLALAVVIIKILNIKILNFGG